MYVCMSRTSIENNYEKTIYHYTDETKGEKKKKDYLSDVRIFLLRHQCSYKQFFCTYPDNKYHWIITNNNCFCLFDKLSRYLPAVLFHESFYLQQNFF